MINTRFIRNGLPQMSNPAVIGRIADSADGSRILDVGCGSGLFGFIVQNEFLTAKTWRSRGDWIERMDGLDFDPFSVESVRAPGIYDNVCSYRRAVLLRVIIAVKPPEPAELPPI